MTEVIRCSNNFNIIIVNEYYYVLNPPTGGTTYINGVEINGTNIWSYTFRASEDDSAVTAANMINGARSIHPSIVIDSALGMDALLSRNTFSFSVKFTPINADRFYFLDFNFDGANKICKVTSIIGSTTLLDATYGLYTPSELKNSQCDLLLFALPIKKEIGGNEIFGYIVFLSVCGQIIPSNWYMSPMSSKVYLWTNAIESNYSNYINIGNGDVDSDEYGNYSTDSGYGQDIDSNTGKARKGSFDNSSDLIEIAKDPSIKVSDAGFVNIYHIGKNQLVNMGKEIFPSMSAPVVPSTGDTLKDICNAIIAMISNFFNFFSESLFNSRLIDYVIDCHIIPCTPIDGTSDYVEVGGKTLSSVAAPKVASDYVTVDCGTLSIEEYYANFLDYYTVCKLYLPFVGFVDLKNEYFQSGSISVVYKFNVIDGSFTCFVKSTSSKSQLNNSVIAQYSGAACVHIPLTGLNYASMIAGVANGVTQAVGGAMALNPVGALDGAMNALSASPDMQQSNGYNSSGAFMGIRTPYLVIERVVPSFSATYTHDIGLPLNVSKVLGDMRGYTVCENVEIKGLDGASQTEIDEIERLLTSGVYL